jgi:hypothetical protein
VPFEADGDGKEVLEFAEESFDEVAVAIEEALNGGDCGRASALWTCAASGHLEAESRRQNPSVDAARQKNIASTPTPIFRRAHDSSHRRLLFARFLEHGAGESGC